MKNIETQSVDEQHTRENHQEGQQVPETATIPGVIVALGDLSPGAILYEQGLAELFNRHPTSIKRAVQRGELPPPTRLFGQNAWTAEVITAHISTRLDKAAVEREQYEQKIRKLSP